MKCFIDANVLVAVLNKEYPAYTSSVSILSLSGDGRFSLYTSALCLGIAFCFSEKKYGATFARARVALLAQHINISACGHKEVSAALSDKKILDFEDGLQYQSALTAGCKVIITYDMGDCHFAQIEVLQPLQFLQQHLQL